MEEFLAHIMKQPNGRLWLAIVGYALEQQGLAFEESRNDRLCLTKQIRMMGTI